jgi:DNA repair protein RecN (Recombination protein N)
MALLRTLRIRNLVIIEDVTVEFGSGLNLLTGETGAGKSILVHALGLVAGLRADRSLVRANEERATVEALFQVETDSAVAAWCGERGIDAGPDGQILICREVAAEGTSRVMLNGSPCTLGMLRELAERLLELHGQHEPKSLLAAERHRELLDRFGGHERERERVSRAHGEVRRSASQLEDLRRHAAGKAVQMEQLQRTVKEIDQLQPRPGELEELESERRVLQNAGRFAELLDQVVTLSYEGDPAAASLAARTAARAEELSELDPSLQELAERARSASTELQDVGSAFRDYRERADFDPERLESVEARRALVERACQCHATDEAGLAERRDAARAELAALQDAGERMSTAAARLVEAEEAYLKASAALSRKRRDAAKKLEEAVAAQFGALALAQAVLKLEFADPGGESIKRPGGTARPFSSAGAERAEFLLAANPGEPLRYLRHVASGGELSRVMLALHVVAQNEDEGRVLVFDEVDAGVGGAVADAVGARLQRLARHHQLLCVTHLPQVAAYADRHFRVRKRVHSGRTRAGIARVSGQDRVDELARMLGGKRPTSASRRHASELLDAAGHPERPQCRSEA